MYLKRLVCNVRAILCLLLRRITWRKLAKNNCNIRFGTLLKRPVFISRLLTDSYFPIIPSLCAYLYGRKCKGYSESWGLYQIRSPISLPLARHQQTVQDQEHGTSALSGVPVYSPHSLLLPNYTAESRRRGNVTQVQRSANRCHHATPYVWIQ